MRVGNCKHHGCVRTLIKGRGYCNAHYIRFMKGTDMDAPLRELDATDEERFWAKVDKSGECWTWMGATLPGGYGVFRIGGRNRVAHRVSWTWSNGAPAPGMEVDHMCFNRPCVNPAHLRLLTHAENGQNRASANSNSKSGVRGVHWAQNQWIAKAQIGDEVFEIGRFNDLGEAERAVSIWRRDHMPASLRDRKEAA